ncbi:hypothetical protein FN846DRAFT_901771 [Sphaerosporella brunnea]|uniref:HTH CENPB-type domain-containing protein n=1 Tax=Sphaerosporella brunnea TaxID=1250544 RepID=A0A5J5FBP4_9PEZI|nr:hypothetical protein FN846DRAFT_901771 [Sphaerosporella brunnea]
MKGVTIRADSQAELQTLTPDEEGEIVRWIEKLDAMAILPRATEVMRMVKAILCKHSPSSAVKMANNKGPTQISKATLVDSTYLHRLQRARIAKDTAAVGNKKRTATRPPP